MVQYQITQNVTGRAATLHISSSMALLNAYSAKQENTSKILRNETGQSTFINDSVASISESQTVASNNGAPGQTTESFTTFNFLHGQTESDDSEGIGDDNAGPTRTLQ